MKKIALKYKNRLHQAHDVGLPRITAIYKEAISVLKDTLEVLWKIAPVALIPPGLLVWSYLKSLKWTSLFYESVVTGGGLVFLALAALLLAFAIATSFVLPSIFLIATAQIYDSKQKITQRTVAQYKWAALGWLATAVGLMYVENEFVLLLFLPPLVLSFGRGLFAIYKSQPPKQTLRESMQALLVATLSALAMNGQIVPLSICIDSFDKLSEATDLEGTILFIAFIIFSTISTVPGFMYLYARTRHTGLIEAFKFPLLGSVLVMYVVLIAAAYFTPVSALVLRAVGVYSESPKTFQILKPELAAALAEANIEIKNKPAISTTSAYVRFHFAGVRLLCKEKYEPTKAAFYQEKNSKKAQLAGLHCVPAKSDELREFTP